MTLEQEKQVLQALYDRIYDAITYQPNAGKSPFTESETFVHFAKNAAIDSNSHSNPRTPSNPTGSMEVSEEFSRMVDMVSPMTLEWDNTGSPLSKTYESIVNGANATTQVDREATNAYQAAYDFLHVKKKQINPFTKKESEIITNSEDYDNYIKNMDEYTDSIMAYRAAYNIYLDDFESKDASIKAKANRNWQLAGTSLSSNIKKAQQALTAGNGEYVEQALDILSTTANDAIRATLADAQDSVKEDRKFESVLGMPEKWLFSYPSPGDWSTKTEGYTTIKLNGTNTKLRSSSSEHKFNVDTKLHTGLWSIQADASGNFDHKTSNTNKDNLEISFDMAKVNIMRPWFNESIFKLSHWYTNLCNKGGISNGKIDSTNKDGMLPMYPVAFIVAKNIKIKADFSNEETDYIKKQVNAGASVGFGPFSISGKYQYGNESKSYDSQIANGEITVPGMQIIGWVSRVIPYSPKEAQPKNEKTQSLKSTQEFDPTDSFDPIFSGLLFGASRSGNKTQGTIGCFIRTNGIPGRVEAGDYLLSCAHVLVPHGNNADPILVSQPSDFLTQGNPNYIIGNTIFGVFNFNNDCAIALLNEKRGFINQVPNGNNGVNFLAGFAAGNVGDVVYKYGIHSTYTTGTIEEINGNVYTIKNEAGWAGGGDSGSVLIRQSDNMVLGLNFGIDNNTYVDSRRGISSKGFAYSIKSQLDNFGTVVNLILP